MNATRPCIAPVPLLTTTKTLLANVEDVMKSVMQGKCLMDSPGAGEGRRESERQEGRRSVREGGGRRRGWLVVVAGGGGGDGGTGESVRYVFPGFLLTSAGLNEHTHALPRADSRKCIPSFCSRDSRKIYLIT